MKKITFILATFAAAFLFTACSADQKLTPEDLAVSKAIETPDFGKNNAQPVAAYQFYETYKATDLQDPQQHSYRVELSQPEQAAPHQFVITGLGEHQDLHVTADMVNETDFEIHRVELQPEGFPSPISIEGRGQKFEGKFFLTYELDYADRKVTAEGYGEIQE